MKEFSWSERKKNNDEVLKVVQEKRWLLKTQTTAEGRCLGI